MDFKLKIWRQENGNEPGSFVNYEIKDVGEESSFLEMLDMVNMQLEEAGETPVHFDHDCREGICGACNLNINGEPHGPGQTTTCQLFMRHFRDGDSITVEPWRSHSFPVIRDLVVDRSSFDRIQQAGGFISFNTGGAPDGNQIPVGKEESSKAMDLASCIGCGACVASCKNSSAMLFVASRVGHLDSLPQGRVENRKRSLDMIAQMDKEGFGACSNTGACAAICPKEIPLNSISKMNEIVLKSFLSS